MSESPPNPLPAGMLTVMFTDVEGSTTHWERQPDAMREAMTSHDELLLQMLYDDALFPGMTADAARPLLEAIATKYTEAANVES